MTDVHELHLTMIRQVAKSLGELCDEVVFTGGVVTGLLLTDPAAGGVRATDDVDLIAGIESHRAYYEFAERLRSHGFVEDPDGPICRWRVHGTVVDVMPTAEAVLGFSNRWYADAIREAQVVVLDRGVKVRVVTPPFFLATKLEAFYGRGRGDLAASHDIEDIIALVDGRPEIVDDVRSAPNTGLREYLRNEFSKLLASDAFITCIPGHLPPSDRGQARGNAVFARLSTIAKT